MVEFVLHVILIYSSHGLEDRVKTMIYGCVECQKIWSSIEELEQIDVANLNLDGNTDISHGICPECFQRHADKVHKHQKNNGYSECYNKIENCSNHRCLFKPACGESAINMWRSSIVVLSPGH